MVNWKVICDFDGTTAQNDVGNLLFRTFADERCFDIVKAWKAGKINSRECLQHECAIASVNERQLASFADSQQLDPFFKEFVEYCRSHKIAVGIASDGLDFYIERIARKHGLPAAVEIRANHLVFAGESGIRAEFPYFDSGCGQCGNCKGYHVRQAQADGNRVIYVGDGLSDRCGARAADEVFAKRERDLLKFCHENRLPHHEYDDFGEVLTKIKDLVKPQ